MSAKLPLTAEQLRHALVQGPAELAHRLPIGRLRPLRGRSRQPLQVGNVRSRPTVPTTRTGPGRPGPHPGWAGSCSSAVKGTAVIVDGPARGACSATTPSSRPAATTGAPDIPDHSDSARPLSSGGSGRGEIDTCTLNSPAASFDNTGTTPIASTVSRTAVGEGVSANHG